MQLFSHDVKIDRSIGYQADGTGDVTGVGVDMQGFEGVCFIVTYVTAASDNLIHAEQGADNSADWQDLKGSEVTLGGSSDEVQWIDVKNPKDRYVRCIAARGTTTVFESIMAYRYGAAKMAVDNSTAGTIAGVALIAPIEGAK